MTATTTRASRRTPLAVTGIGVVAPTGLDAEQHWSAVLSGKSGIDRISRFDPSSYPVTLAGEVAGFVASDSVPGRVLSQTDHWTHLALHAADAALADAQVDPAQVPEYDMAVVTASSSGGTEFGQRENQQLYSHGPGWVGAYQSIAWFYAATTGQLSIRHGMRGPCGVFCTEQAGGLDALGQARRLVRDGVQVVLTGGTDASLCPYGLVAQLASGLLSESTDPLRAYLPFDEDAHGYVPGEGGAILVTERATDEVLEKSYGVLRGYAAGFDLPGRATSLARTIRRALADAQADPSEVDVVYADALGTPDADRAEATALAEVFGPRGVPVTAPKTLTGRLYGGGAALDVATALLGQRDGVVPPTAGTTRPRPEIDLVRAPRELALRASLVVSRGFGGFHAAVLLGAGR